MTKLLALFSFFLFLSSSVCAQYFVEGVVTGSNDEPLCGATVLLIQQRDSAILASTLTQTNGKFSIRAERVPEASLKVSFIGYEDSWIPAPAREQTSVGKISLKVQDYNIENVVVTGEKPAFQQLSDKFVFNVDATPLSKGVDAITVLKQTPFLKVNERDHLSILGKSGVVVKINGRDSKLSGDALAGYLRSLPSDNIKAIEVVTVLGSDQSASGDFGIVNIVLARNEQEGLNGNVSFYDSQNTFENNPNGNVNLNYRKGKVGVSTSLWAGRSVFVMDSHSNTLIKKTDTDIISKNKSDQGGFYTGGNIGLDYNINKKHTLGAYFSRSYNRGLSHYRDHSEYRTAQQADSLMRSYTYSSAPANQTSANLSYTFDIDPSKQRLMIDVGYANSRRRSFSQTIGDRLDETGQILYRNADFIQRVPAKVDSWSAKIDYNRTFDEKNSMQAGAAFFSTHTDNDSFFGIPDANGDYKNDPNRSNHFIYNENIAALYGSYKRQWNADIETTIGVRGEYMHSKGDQKMGNVIFNRDKFNIFPSISFSFKGKLSYNITSRVRRPSFSELNPFRSYNSATTYVENNPFLKSSWSLYQELNYIFKNQLILRASYNVNYDSWAQFTIPEEGNILRYTLINYGNDKNFTLTATYNKSFFNGVWQTMTSVYYTYMQFQGAVLDEKLKNHSSQFAFNTNHTFRLSEKHQWFFNIFYFLDTPYYNGQTKFLSSNSLSLRLQKRFKKVNLSASVNDVFDSTRSRAKQNSRDLQSYVYHNFGSRSFSISISYNFGGQKVKGREYRNLSNSEIQGRL